MQGVSVFAGTSSMLCCRFISNNRVIIKKLIPSSKSAFVGGEHGIKLVVGVHFGFLKRRHRIGSVLPLSVLPLTEENVEMVLDEVRPSLMADGGNVALHEIDGLVVVLKLQGACGSCPSSAMTLKMGIEARLRDKIPEIEAVEQTMDTETGLDLNDENVEKALEVVFFN
ncbi:unnamed protein product [Victoria cruziana]